MNIILFGPPGSGKGTQAGRISESVGLEHVSVGDLYRQHMELDTEFGMLARKLMGTGRLFPDESTHRMLSEKLNELDGEGFVIDGYPRTLAQAEFLSESSIRIDRMYALTNVSEETLFKRLSNRWTCDRCYRPFSDRSACCGNLFKRSDDSSEDVIGKRLSVYNTESLPVYHYYVKRGSLLSVNADQPVEDITNVILRDLSFRCN